MEGEPASDKDKLLLITLAAPGARRCPVPGRACGARRVVVCVPAGRDRVAAAVPHAIAERRARRATRRCPRRSCAHRTASWPGRNPHWRSWVDSGQSLPVVPARQEHPSAHRETPRAGAQRRDAGARRPHRPARARGPSEPAGLAEEPGTSLVTISGTVEHPGVVEVDRGTPLLRHRQPGRPLRARRRCWSVATAGPGWAPSISPRRTPPSPCGPSAPPPASASSSSSGQRACGVAESARIARYLAGQSAGQCGPCVFGLPAVADDLARLARGEADPGSRRRASPAAWPKSTGAAPAGTPTARSTWCAAPCRSSPPTSRPTPQVHPARTGAAIAAPLPARPEWTALVTRASPSTRWPATPTATVPSCCPKPSASTSGAIPSSTASPCREAGRQGAAGCPRLPGRAITLRVRERR